MREEFSPELVTIKVPRPDPVFPGLQVTSSLYPVDRAGRLPSSSHHFECSEHADQTMMTDLSLLAISGRGQRGFHVHEDSVPAYSTLAVLLKGKKTW